jgi:hypothetical protein
MANPPFGEGLSFELLAASLHADAGDAQAFLEALATRLGGALPSRTLVQRAGGLFGGPKRVQVISLELGEFHYQIGQQHGALVPQRTRVVRGIALKTEALRLEQWLNELTLALLALAEQSAQDRAAVQRMLL